MKTKLYACLGIFGLTAALNVLAAPNAVVDAVQAPAWVERDGRLLPLAPGMALENRDHLRTGENARLIVQFADGSAVKLGANSQVVVNAMQRSDNGIFKAALDMSKGAFRFTTDIFRKYQDKRAINIRSGSVTIGIRGTDLWGRASDERDFVCLLEGRIVASHPLGEPAELSEPLQFYGADKGQAPGAVATADRVQVYKWALETELQDGVGTRRADGRWFLRYGPFSEEETLSWHDRLAAAGHAAKIRPFKTADGYRYELRLGQLVTEREALALAGRLARELNLSGAAANPR